MKKEVADLWIAALESGEYAQTTGALHVLSEHVGARGNEEVIRTKGYCCLGVLCEVAIKNGLDLKRRINIASTLEYFDEANGVAPAKVMKWSGLKSATGDFYTAPVDDFTCLTQLNDDGTSFQEIANIIREHWEKL